MSDLYLLERNGCAFLKFCRFCFLGPISYEKILRYKVWGLMVSPLALYQYQGIITFMLSLNPSCSTGLSAVYSRVRLSLEAHAAASIFWIFVVDTCSFFKNFGS